MGRLTLGSRTGCYSPQVTDDNKSKRRSRQARKEVRNAKRTQATTFLKLAHKRNLQVKKQRRKQLKDQHICEVRLKKQAKRLEKHQGH